MPKITITFQEQGSDPITVELNEKIAGILDKFVEDQVETSTNENGETVSTPKYTGKADLFMKHTQASLIQPLVEKYVADFETNTVAQIAALEEQKKALENTIKNNFAPKLV